MEYSASQPPIVDGHLDLAENVTLFGHDLTLSVAERRARERRTSQQAMVSLPEMERGGIAVAFATVTPGFLVADVGVGAVPDTAYYTNPEEAEAQALRQIMLYDTWEHQGHVRLLKSVTDLDDHLALWQTDRTPGLVLLMEGADPIVHVRDLLAWWRRGLRMIGLTYGDTVYGTGVASGTTPFKRGGLTPEGIALLNDMAEIGFLWDVSHLAEEGVWQGLDLNFPRVFASHANARALTPTDRHLSDDTLRALAGRGGVIGLVLYNAFLDPRWRQDRSLPVTLDDQVRRQVSHIASVTGWDHVAIGSDLDGGLGLEETPSEIDTIADLFKIGAVVPAEMREGILSANWLNFLRAALPESS